MDGLEGIKWRFLGSMLQAVWVDHGKLRGLSEYDE